MKEQILEQFDSELSRSSDHTRKDRVFYARKFLDFVGDRALSEWNKTVVQEFLRELEGQRYAPGTIRKVYSIVKRVFDSAKAVHEAERTRLISGVDAKDPGAVAEILKAISLPAPTWDLGKRSAPRVESEAVVKPANTLEQMKAMIAVNKGVLTTPEVVYSAFSSIYGLRREELCRVRKEHIDIGEKTIYVLTAKGGERRKQLLCDEIIPILKGYDFKKQYSPFQMSELYWRICAKAGIDVPKESGWHAIRRFLDTVLVETFGELPAHIFLRWKISTSSLMTERYFNKDPLEVDKAVLEGHPLVPLWR